MINKLEYPASDRSLLGAVITLLIALGFGVSVQIRCIMVLVLPNFFGKNGRHLISSVAMLYLISGRHMCCAVFLIKDLLWYRSEIKGSVCMRST